MVLHDLNLAARYADHLVAMADGVVVAEGSLAAVTEGDRLEDRYFALTRRSVA